MRVLTPGGLLVLGGAPKVGKSDFLISLMARLNEQPVLAFTAGGRRFGLGFLSCMAAPAALFGVATAVVTAALPQ